MCLHRVEIGHEQPAPERRFGAGEELFGLGGLDCCAGGDDGAVGARVLRLAPSRVYAPEHAAARRDGTGFEKPAAHGAVHQRDAELGAAALQRQPGRNIVQPVEGEAAAAQQPGAVVLSHELRHGLKADLRRDERRPLLRRSGLALTYAQRRREQLRLK